MLSACWVASHDAKLHSPSSARVISHRESTVDWDLRFRSGRRRDENSGRWGRALRLVSPSLCFVLGMLLLLVLFIVQCIADLLIDRTLSRYLILLVHLTRRVLLLLLAVVLIATLLH